MSRMHALSTGRRFAVTSATAAVLSLFAAVAGGHPRLGFGVFGALVLMGLLGLLPGELMSVIRVRADERQREMFLVAALASDQVVRAVVMIGLLIELYRGTPGPFLLVAVVGSVAEVAALLILPRMNTGTIRR